MSTPTEPMPTWPYFDDEQIDVVAEVLRSGKINYWTGEHGRLFEQEFAEYVGCRYGIALANGSVALELALYALNIGVGDEVITSSRTYIASASSIVLRGATPVFADVDRDSQNLTLETVKKVVSPNTKAIIAVHLAGWPSITDDLMSFATETGIKVIEDCAQAQGATYKGRQVGSFGHVAAFSFCQDKIMTTGGEGGMVTTNDLGLWSKMWSYKDHGKSWDLVHEQKNAPGFKWLHDSIGTNWRMTEMQAALGRLQLKKLADWTLQRRSNAQRIWNAIASCVALRVPEIPNDIQHAAYKCYAFVRPEKLRSDWSRDRVIAEINALGVACFSGSCAEVYREQAFDQLKFKPSNRHPMAQELGETSLMFLVHPTLSESDIERSCAAIIQVMESATDTGARP